MSEAVSWYQLEQFRKHGFWVRDWMPGGLMHNVYSKENQTLRAVCDDEGIFLCKPPKGHGVYSKMFPKADGEYLEIWRVHPSKPDIAYHVKVCEDHSTHLPVPFGERIVRELVLSSKMTDEEFARRLLGAIAKSEKDAEDNAMNVLEGTRQDIRKAMELDFHTKLHTQVLADTDTRTSAVSGLDSEAPKPKRSRSKATEG